MKGGIEMLDVTNREELLEWLYMFFEAAGFEDERISAELDDASLEELIEIYTMYTEDLDDEEEW